MRGAEHEFARRPRQELAPLFEREAHHTGSKQQRGKDRSREQASGVFKDEVHT